MKKTTQTIQKTQHITISTHSESKGEIIGLNSLDEPKAKKAPKLSKLLKYMYPCSEVDMTKIVRRMRDME